MQYIQLYYEVMVEQVKFSGFTMFGKQSYLTLSTEHLNTNAHTHTQNTQRTLDTLGTILEL